MTKFNRAVSGKGASSPLTTVSDGVKTYGGGPGFVSDPYSETFRLGVNLLAGDEETYYESGKSRDKRFIDLIEGLAVQDPTWIYNFLTWLRREGNVRTAAIMGAAHAVHARLNHSPAVTEDELLSSLGMTGINRSLVRDVLFRADEPGEFAAYYMSKFGSLPKSAKRGLADAVNELYNEYSVMKYDTSSHDVRFADVLNLTHASPSNRADMFDRMPAWKLEEMSEEGVAAYSAKALANKKRLFSHIINRRYGNDETLEGLPMIQANLELRKEAAKNPRVLLDFERLKAAGMTWEDTLSLAGPKMTKKEIWEALIDADVLGIFALVRNLRNLEQAGISNAHRNKVIDKITNPKIVAKSRMFPFRFLSAFQNTNSLHFQAALEEALNHSVQNIPELTGRTLILVDTSGSMSAGVSNHSNMSRAGLAALFGAILANRNAGKVDLVMFADYSKSIDVPRGGSVLKIVEDINRKNGQVGHGTRTADAITSNFKKGVHNRVIIFTDMQSFATGRSYGYSSYGGYYGGHQNLGDLVPPEVHMYSFDLAGYKNTDMDAGGNRRHQLGGPTDATFKWIALVERGYEARWPWIKG